MVRSRTTNDDGLREALSQIPDRFVVVEEELDGAVHAEFARNVQRLMACQSQEVGLEARQALFDPTAPLEVKREILVTLALSETVDAYRAH